MTYNDLRRSIYESYQSGEISGPQATQMLEKVMDIEGDHIVAEYEALESTFMGVAMEAANGYMDFTDFQEQAQIYTEGVKEIWTKFVDWIKGIISAIFGIEFKGNPTIEVNGDKVSLYQKFTAFCKKFTSKSADKTNESLVGELVGLAAAAGASIFAGHKVKMKYKKFAAIQEEAVKSGKNVVEWMADPDNKENETLKEIGAKGQAAIKRIFEAVKQDKKGVVGRIRQFIGKKIGITREELENDHSKDNAADDEVIGIAGNEVPPDSTDLPDVRKNKEEYKKKFGKYPPKGYGPEDIASALAGGMALERKKIDMTGDVFTESSSWDDIFAYMDI